jgi:Notch-like protein
MIKLSISSPMIYICDGMLSTGKFPTYLKCSQVLPVYKKGNRVEISAYKPISLLTSFSKIFEKNYL